MFCWCELTVQQSERNTDLERSGPHHPEETGRVLNLLYNRASAIQIWRWADHIIQRKPVVSWTYCTTEQAQYKSGGELTTSSRGNRSCPELTVQQSKRNTDLEGSRPHHPEETGRVLNLLYNRASAIQIWRGADHIIQRKPVVSWTYCTTERAQYRSGGERTTSSRGNRSCPELTVQQSESNTDLEGSWPHHPEETSRVLNLLYNRARAIQIWRGADHIIQRKPVVSWTYCKPVVSWTYCKPVVSWSYCKPAVSWTYCKPVVSWTYCTTERAQYRSGGEQTTSSRGNQSCPELTVNQSCPEVTVNQSCPELTVNQSCPELTVQQSERNTDLEGSRPHHPEETSRVLNLL